ncbi:MAG TPA: hypothetical protein VGB94_09900, partial [Acidobacteriaceae bacterium]
MQTLFQNDPEKQRPEDADAKQLEGVGAVEEEKAEEPAGRRRFWRWRRGVKLPSLPSLPEPKFKDHHTLVRVTFGIFLLLSAVFGVMVGLMFIYATNLPQIDEL